MGEARNVLLAVRGGIAAYKTAFLARRLVEAGHDVVCIMSRSAKSFLGAQTLAAITANPVRERLLDGSTPSPHTELARWADVVVVAPATAAFLGRLAAGISDDLATATLAATTCPVVLAPAMHTEMWEHPATRRNCARLGADGYRLVGPVRGALAGGDTGIGRLVPPEVLVAEVEAADRRWDLYGRRVMITAGGTRESIDPVRFIGNRSSGKMGHAVATAAAARGAAVDLVTAASPLPAHPSITTHAVETAAEMAAAAGKLAGEADVAVFAAAVADFRPASVHQVKLRRADGPPRIEVEPTPDVMGGVAASTAKPFIVGFAAETGSLERAKEKAVRPGVGLLVANDVTDPESGFGTDTNRVVLIEPDGTMEHLPLLSKWDVAMRILDEAAARIGEAAPL